MTGDVTSCRELPGESAVLRYLLQYAILTGWDAFGRSTISIPLNDWLVGQLTSVMETSQQQETVPVADVSIGVVYHPLVFLPAAPWHDSLR